MAADPVASVTIFAVADDADTRHALMDSLCEGYTVLEAVLDGQWRA